MIILRNGPEPKTMESKEEAEKVIKALLEGDNTDENESESGTKNE